jgi:predicted Ser/Thr protein kinase
MICALCTAENETNVAFCLRCGHDLAGAFPLDVGSVVADRYELLSVVGRGGMGVVFKARDRLLEEPVALKVLREDVRLAHEGSRRFRSEIKLARRVSHKNVCRIHEYGEHAGLRYISMELVDGVDLKELLAREGPRPAAEALAMAVAMTEAVAAVHAEGIVHRDLKSSNVMRDRAGEVRVLDFGIARDERLQAGPTVVGQIMGTAEYMSPEQARGDTADFRSDVYALGIVLYELITGRVPFHGDNAASTMLMQIYSPPPLDDPLLTVTPPLVALLGRALAKDPKDRFQTAEEMAAGLRQLRDGESLELAVPTPDEPAAPRPGGPAWFYAVAGRRQGPVDTDGLVRALVTLPDPRRARVWREGMADWTEAGTVPGLKLALPPALEGGGLPGTPTGPHGSFDAAADPAEVRRLYRQLLSLLGVEVLAWIIPVVPSGTALLPESLNLLQGGVFFTTSLMLLVAIPMTAHRLARRMSSPSPGLWAAAMTFPCTNILFAVGLGIRMEQWCREHGVSAGLLGPD